MGFCAPPMGCPNRAKLPIRDGRGPHWPERLFGRLKRALRQRLQRCRGTGLNLPREAAGAARGGHLQDLARGGHNAAIKRHVGSSRRKRSLRRCVDPRDIPGEFSRPPTGHQWGAERKRATTIRCQSWRAVALDVVSIGGPDSSCGLRGRAGSRSRTLLRSHRELLIFYIPFLHLRRRSPVRRKGSPRNMRL